LSNLTFKVIPDPSSRNQALQSGSVDMIWTQDNPSIKALGSMKGITYRTDANDSRSPSVNCLLLNTSGTLNQYFAWAGQFAALGIPGSLTYLLQGQNPPAAVQQANLNPAPGAVDPTTLNWNPKLKPVLNDPNVREALAMALNRQTYHSAIENNVGQIADGIYRPNSPFYQNPGYPSYNQAKAKSMIDAYKQANGLSSVGFVIDIVSGDAAAQKQFAFFSAAFSAIGVTVTPRPLVQSTLINNVIAGEFDCATWNQFGGNDPATNYVWFVSIPAAASLASGGLGMSSLPSNVNIPGAVNFAHLGDPDVERDMLAGLAAAPGTAAHVSNWAAVNTQFAQDIPYLYLDYTLTAFAARSNVQNWGRAVAGDGHTAAQQFSGGSAKWESIWKS
jgi:ABC-type transport system substrate-binding protein